MLQPCSVLEEESVVGDSSSLVDSEPVVYGNVKVTVFFLAVALPGFRLAQFWHD